MAYIPQQADGPSLRYPENLGLHATITYEYAVTMLLRAVNLSPHFAYNWGYIDKPSEGQLHLLFLTGPFPQDGIRYQEQETRFVIPVGNARELEVFEVKYGFVPGQDTGAYRARRRYRLHKGGHPQLVLVHYFRGPYAAIPPAIMSQPIRSYPLPAVHEPSVYVMGEKTGQKVYRPSGPGPGSGPTNSGPIPPVPGPGPGPGGPIQHGPPPIASGVHGPTPSMQPQTHGLHPTMSAAGPGAHPHGHGMPMNMGMPMNVHQQHALLAQQNNTMEALERRRERERAAARPANIANRTTQPPRPEDDDSGDELEHISTRTLALTRYKRNHELMNQIFQQAAFGDKSPVPPKSPYAIFDQSELDAKVEKLNTEIDEIRRRASERAAAATAAANARQMMMPPEHPQDPSDHQIQYDMGATMNEGITA